MLSEDIEKYIEEHLKEAHELFLTLARIPAPSNHEEKRARFCEKWLNEQGAKGVYVDPALNVVYPADEDGDKPVEVFMAHLDVVFPDETELPLRVENGRVYCPGAGDDTACLVCLLMAAKYIAARVGTPEWERLRGPGAPGIVLVCNSGEEGLGNLKGVRRICQDYGDRMEMLCAFDSPIEKAVNRAVGSRRFKVAVHTQGGHSFNDFGQDNAIEKLAAILCRLSEIPIPPGGKTTYNAGVISGGTSVNTIAQDAEMLWEFRSDRRENLEYMEEHFRQVLEQAEREGTQVACEVVGTRPCEGEVDPVKREKLAQRAKNAVEKATGRIPQFNAGSTDCNIPLSLGIPSICIGCYKGEGAHTRQEYVEIDSLKQGMAAALYMILEPA